MLTRDWFFSDKDAHEHDGRMEALILSQEPLALWSWGAGPHPLVEAAGMQRWEWLCLQGPQWTLGLWEHLGFLGRV